MDTKLKADIAESATVTELLKRGFNVLLPFGDRLSYDIAADYGDKLIKIQVKSAWIEKKTNRYVVDVRQTKTNRRKMIRKYYTDKDFDFAIIYIPDSEEFFIIPVQEFRKYKSSMTLREANGRIPKFDRMTMKKFRNQWNLLNGPANQ